MSCPGLAFQIWLCNASLTYMDLARRARVNFLRQHHLSCYGPTCQVWPYCCCLQTAGLSCYMHKPSCSQTWQSQGSIDTHASVTSLPHAGTSCHLIVACIMTSDSWLHLAWPGQLYLAYFSSIGPKVTSGAAITAPEAVPRKPFSSMSMPFLRPYLLRCRLHVSTATSQVNMAAMPPELMCKLIC